MLKSGFIWIESNMDCTKDHWQFLYPNDAQGPMTRLCPDDDVVLDYWHLTKQRMSDIVKLFSILLDENKKPILYCYFWFQEN